MLYSRPHRIDCQIGKDLSFYDIIINNELCYPGAVTGSTEVECPHCDELLTVPVDDPMGEESYQCCECGGGFDVDWGSGEVRQHD